MKRKESYEIPPNKIRKPNHPEEESIHQQANAISDDMIYEISKWLSPSDILRNCVFINKQWMNVIKKRAELEFHFDRLQWKSFSSEERSMSDRITQLSVKYFDPSDELSIRALEGMCALNKLTLFGTISGSFVNEDLIETILSKDSFREFRVTRCDLTPEGIALLKEAMPRVKVFMSVGCLLDDDQIDHDYIRLLSGLDMRDAPGSTNEEFIDSLYTDLAEGGNISELCIDLNAFSAEQLPSMKNLEHLTIYNSELSYDELPDLSTLSKLKSITMHSESVIGDVQAGKIPLERLVGSLDKLTHLQFRSGARREDLEIIARANNLSSLTYPCMYTGVISISGLRLTELNARGSIIDRNFLHALKGMTSLTKLDMASTNLSGPSFTIADLCDYKDGVPECRLKLLTTLRIRPPPPQQRNAFMALRDMSHLKKLVLSGSSEYTDGICGIEYLVQNKSITRLKSIGSQINRETVNELCKMHQLTDLRIHAPSIDDACLKSILSMTHLRRLELYSKKSTLTTNVAQGIRAMTNLYALVLSGFSTDRSDKEEIRAMTKPRHLSFSDFNFE